MDKVKSIPQAVQILSESLIPRLEVYKVNRDDESASLPQAIFVSVEELRALSFVIGTAVGLNDYISKAIPVPPKTTDAFGE